MDEYKVSGIGCMNPNAACNIKECRSYGFSFKEAERRKKLPVVKLPNGLYGKRVAKQMQQREGECNGNES